MAPVLDSTPRDTPESMMPSKKAAPKPATESANFTKRLQTELMTFMLSSSPGISAFPSSDADLSHWTATITGPADTCYDGMNFRLSFEFPANYPYAPPKVLFVTPIYHPNIDMAGRICLDILKDKWSAGLDVKAVLMSIQSLLEEPNNSSPLNGQAAELWDKDREEYKRQVVLRHKEPVAAEAI